MESLGGAVIVGAESSTAGLGVPGAFAPGTPYDFAALFFSEVPTEAWASACS